MHDASPIVGLKRKLTKKGELVLDKEDEQRESELRELKVVDLLQ